MIEEFLVRTFRHPIFQVVGRGILVAIISVNVLSLVLVGIIVLVGLWLVIAAR